MISRTLGRAERKAGSGSHSAGGNMSLVSHLAELRRRVIISLAAIGIGAVAGFALWDPILEIATNPYCAAQAARGAEGFDGGSACQLYITSPLELFTTRLTVAGYLGFIFAFPIVLWQLWRFVTPGLEAGEKRYAVPFVLSSVILFGLGAVVAWVTFPRALSFFLAVGGDHVQTLFNPAPYLKLIFLMTIIFGAVFEFPVLLVCLQIAGVVSSKRLRSWRRQAIVGNTVIAAVATPSQDPWSMAAMAIPLCIFYEAAILIGRALKK